MKLWESPSSGRDRGCSEGTVQIANEPGCDPIRESHWKSFERLTYLVLVVSCYFFFFFFSFLCLLAFSSSIAKAGPLWRLDASSIRGDPHVNRVLKMESISKEVVLFPRHQEYCFRLSTSYSVTP